LFGFPIKERREAKMNFFMRPSVSDLPINQGICFSNHKNKYEENSKKIQLKLLKNFAPFLKQILEPDEEILYVVKACSPASLFEQIITGWILYYIKRCALIFTNKRILHLPTKINFSPKNSAAQVRYGDIGSFKIDGFGGRVLALMYRSGVKEKFYYIKSKDRKKLKTILPLLVSHGIPSEMKQRHHLCPRCTAPLLKDEFSCPDCRLEFKNAAQALKLSLLFPGGGYFYTGHPVLGIADAVTEAVLLIALVVGLVDGFEGTGPWPAVIMLAIVLLLEKLITIYHARNFVAEYIPVDQDFTPIRRSQSV